VGIDIVSTAIKAATKFAEQKGITNLCSFVEGNIFHLPFPDNTFDVVRKKKRKEKKSKEQFKLTQSLGFWSRSRWTKSSSKSSCNERSLSCFETRRNFQFSSSLGSRI